MENTQFTWNGIPENTREGEVNAWCMGEGCDVIITSSEEGPYLVPSRGREDTIEGFNKSRRMTAMIESTFGLVMAQMTPSSILSMGGDEMIASIEGADFREIEEVVENHSQKFHTDFFGDGEEPELLWWAMMCERDEIAEKTTSMFKDTLRKYRCDYGSRFVFSMWPGFID